jgi:hypothetical protein
LLFLAWLFHSYWENWPGTCWLTGRANIMERLQAGGACYPGDGQLNMKDEMDVYISRNLKNWAARQQPPGGMRGHLLKEAGAASLPKQTNFFSRYLVRFLNRQYTTFNPEDWLSEPFTQSRAWSFHIASTLRHVA